MKPSAGWCGQKGAFLKEQIRGLFKDVWNVPNVLTMLRLLLIPVFVAVYVHGHRFTALAVFCVASLTDALDGIIARKYNLVTSFGKLMDPLADKLMVCTALICQGISGIFPWSAIIIVALKETVMVAGGAYMLGKGVVVYANWAGKIATVSFILSLILSFFHPEFEARGLHMDRIVLWISVGLALIALVDYSLMSWKRLRGRQDG